MTTAYTSLLGLALPVTGELAGQWGDTVNDYITKYMDAAVAGAQTISGTQTAVTLSVTNGSALSQAGTGGTGSAQYQIINCTGSPASLLTITVPAQSKVYLVLNATSTSQSVKVVGTGPTTGVTIISGEKALIAWNGSDFVKIATAGGSPTFTDVTVTGTTTLSGLTASTALALNGSKQVVSVTNTGTGNNVLSASPTLTGTIGGASMTLSSLTSGRVTYAGASGLLTDSSSLTFDGTTLTAGGLSTGGSLTLSGGTANGVLYLNGSKVATSGSALTFDGTNLGVGTASPATHLHVSGLGAQYVRLQTTSTNGQTAAYQLYAPNSDGSGNAYQVGSGLTADNEWTVQDITDGKTVDKYIRGSSGYRAFYQNGSEQMRLTSTGLGIGTSSPGAKLGVSATYSSDTGVQERFYDNTGTALNFGGTAGGKKFIQAQDSAGAALYYDILLNPSGGNLGIGTSSPVSKLQVSSGASAGDLKIGSFSAYNAVSLNGNFTTSTAMGMFGGGAADADLYIQNASGGGHKFRVGTTTVAYLDSSGNLGLGVTPSAWNTAGKAVEVSKAGNAIYSTASNTRYDTSNAYLNSSSNWIYSATNYATYYGQYNGTHSWYTAPSGTAGNAITFTQAMTLDASGNLEIGGTFAQGRRLNVDSATDGYTVSLLQTGAFNSGKLSGTVFAGYYDGSSITDMASIRGGKENTTSGNYAGMLAFYTRTNGGSDTERARITSGGNLFVGDTTSTNARFRALSTASNSQCAWFTHPTSNQDVISCENSATSGDNRFITFYTDATVNRGAITYNRGGGVVAYNTTSDYRAKDILGPVANPGATIDALKVYIGKMRGATIERPMFIAHEAQEIVPYAVTGKKDAVKEDGTPDYQQMDHQVLVPLLIAELQSLRKRVAQLEGK